MQLQIETTNVCQAACVFCEYPTMRRPKGTMPMSLFMKIIDEAADIPVIDHLTITGLGEPLLDRFLVERVAYIREKMSQVPIDVFTNGNLLRPATTDALIAAGLTTLYVSLNAVDAGKRRDVMKLDDWDTVIPYIHYAKEACAKSGTCRTVVKGIVSKDLMENGEQQIFLDQWGGPSDRGGNAFLHLEGNWAGAVWPMRVLMNQPCGRALNQIMVLQDGRVSLCCFDGEGREILGDLNSQSIREVFNSERATYVRQAHAEGRRNEISICAGCTGI